ncbi:MAG: DNRLRE domain-containing protein [bacterium]
MIRITDNNRGIALVMIMGMVLILEVICLSLSQVRSSGTTIAHNRILQLKALYCAEAGIAHELWRIQEDSNWRFAPADHTLGDGSYTISFSENTAQEKIIITCNARVKGVTSSARRTVRMLTIQPHHTAGGVEDDEDTYIKEGKPDDAQDYKEELLLDTENSGGTYRCRTLVKFALHKYPLPQDAVIVSSLFSMYLVKPFFLLDFIVFGIINDSYRIHKITQEWRAHETTWNHRNKDEDLKWESPGGDFDPAYEDSRNFKNRGWQSWRVTSMTRSWLNDPDKNYGFIIEATGRPNNNECKFISSDEEDGDSYFKVPKLTIYYIDTRSP